MLAAVLAVGAAVGVATGVAKLSVLADLGRAIASVPVARGLGILLVGGALAGGCLWVWTLIRYARRTREKCVDCGRPGAAWTAPGSVTRWGRWVTIAAACGPLPYALIRLTWLTPWPYGFSHAELVAHPEMRLFGVSLGLAALAGSVLTIGLIRPWGEVFPRWIPWLRGRTVPVLLPTAIALVVGTAVTVAGKSFLQMVLAEPEHWGLLFVFPFPIWGPLLIAAAAAYYLRRRGRCQVCGQS